MPPKDYYQILGVSRDASDEDIRKAFRHLALRYHPDHNPRNAKEAEEIFKEINNAYEVLGDEQKRRHYNHLIGWQDYRQKTVVAEDIFEAACMNSSDSEWIKEILEKFTGLDHRFTVFGHGRSWGCKRQRGWWCRRERQQE